MCVYIYIYYYFQFIDVFIETILIFTVLILKFSLCIGGVFSLASESLVKHISDTRPRIPTGGAHLAIVGLEVGRWEPFYNKSMV